MRSGIDQQQIQNACNKFLTPLGDVREWCKAFLRSWIDQKKIQNAYNKFLTPLGDVLEWCKASCGAGLTKQKSKMPTTTSLRRSVTSLSGVKPFCGAGLTKRIKNAYSKFLTPLGDVLEKCKAACGAGSTNNKSNMPTANSLHRSVTSLNGVRPLAELD